MADFSGWSHYRDITVPAAKIPAGGPHVSFPLAIDLAATGLLAYAQADGRDVRAAQTDDTPLDYVLVPRGEFVCRDGIWTWFSMPVAIYDPTGDGALYVGVFNDNLDDWVRVWKYDFGTKQYSVGSWENGDDPGDDHNNPALVQRSDGRIIAFAPSHNKGGSDLPYRITTNPRDITAWGAEKNVTGYVGAAAVSYAQPWRIPSLNSGQFIFLITRNGLSQWKYAQSTDDGDTFTSVANFWSAGTSPYMVSISNGSRIDFLASQGHPANADGFRAWHWYFDATDSTFRATDGSLLNADGSIPAAGFTPSDMPAASLVIDNSAGSDEVWIANIGYNSAGDPIPLLLIYPSGGFTAPEVWWAEYEGGWSAEKIVTTGQLAPVEVEEYTYGACVDPTVAKGVYVGVPVSGEGELQRWQDSGSGWAKTEDITSGSDGPNFRPFTPHGHPQDGTGGAVVWCAGGEYVDFVATGGGWESAIRAHPPLDHAARSIRVRVPSMSDGADTVVRIYAGNPAATDTQSWTDTYPDAAEVLDLASAGPNARAVIGRITGNAYALANHPEVREDIATAVPAMQITSAALSEGAQHRIEGPAVNLAGLDGITVECLARYNSAGSNEHTVLANLEPGAAQAGFLLRLEPTDDSVEVFADTSGGRMTGNTAGSVIPANTDHTLALVFNGDDGGNATLAAQVDTSRTTVATASGTRTMNAGNSTQTFRLFRWPTADAMTGAIGEPRLWAEPKPEGWVSLTHANFFDDEFFTFGSLVSQAPDETPPVLTGLQVATPTADGGNLTVTTDEDNGYIRWVVVADGEVPSDAEVLLGQTEGGGAALASGNVSVSSTGVQALATLTGLGDGTTFDAFAIQIDDAANQSDKLAGTFTTASAPDETAPTLSLPAALLISTNGVAPVVTTDEANGTLYVVIVPDGDEPSVAQIKAGQQSDGSPALASASQAVSSTGVQIFAALGGLEGETAYEEWFAHTDAAGNDSDPVTVGFVTKAEASAAVGVTRPVMAGGLSAGVTPGGVV